MSPRQAQRRGRTLLILAGVSVAIAAPAAAKVETTWHRNADPAGYHTYSWADTTVTTSKAIDTVGTDFEIFVRQAIEQRLRSIGFEKAAADRPPDFRIQYTASVAESTIRDVGPTPVPFNDSDWVLRGYETLRVSFSKATLTLTVRDGGTDEPVWCGWTSERIKPRRLEQQAQTWVRRILRRFPPEIDANALRP